jgi:hypothetical protein
VVGVLTEPRWVDMFWDSYQLEVVALDPEFHLRMSTRTFWASNAWHGMVFRSRAFGEIAPDAFPSAGGLLDDGRLLMRGLYLNIQPPRVWDRLLLRWRDRARRVGVQSDRSA